MYTGLNIIKTYDFLMGIEDQSIESITLRNKEQKVENIKNSNISLIQDSNIENVEIKQELSSKEHRELPINKPLNILTFVGNLFYNIIGLKKSIIILGPSLVVFGGFRIINNGYETIQIISLFMLMIIFGIIFSVVFFYDKRTCKNCNKKFNMYEIRKLFLDEYDYKNKRFFKTQQIFKCQSCGYEDIQNETEETILSN